MTKSMRALLVGAALSGFVAGTTVTVKAQDKSATPDNSQKATKTKVEKHACKGKNSCKGKGGCGDTKGKNDCKGKGQCRTDGKPMNEAPKS
jgi:hypothetical protein